MFNRRQLVFKYLQYRLSASNGKGHGMHSPFIFGFITKVLNDKSHYGAYDEVEQVRKELLSDPRICTIKDLGAGSVAMSDKRSVASIARTSVKPRKYAQLIFRIAKYYKVKYVIELGTSLGLTTAYLSKAMNDKGFVSTVEGSADIAAIARNNFDRLGLQNVTLINEPFEDCLPNLQQTYPWVDLIFLDGNHRLEPTLNYFEKMLKTVKSHSIMIIDDIHWSTQMEGAWKQICAHPAVRCSVDLFYLGIVFFREEFREKQHFTIRF